MRRYEPKQKIKYVLHPGMGAVSPHAGRSLIGSDQLAHLYGVAPNQCIVFKAGGPRHDDLWHLYPRDDGQYSYPGTGIKKQMKPFLK